VHEALETIFSEALY